ncbi:MAG: hypothetical protein M3492_07265 [Actinomycetota bacterium]|nr:hypothetical protein [Actinomycetota bacterium]
MHDLLELARTPKRGAPRLRQAVRFVDARSEFAGESLLRVLHAVCGVPVESQLVIQDDEGFVVARADLHILGTRRLPEYDGAYHRDTGSIAGAKALPNPATLQPENCDSDEPWASGVARTPDRPRQVASNCNQKARASVVTDHLGTAVQPPTGPTLFPGLLE